MADFIFLGSKITADDDCSHEIKRLLLFERKAMTNLDSILKSRDITLPTKVCLVKAMVFPVVMYGCESWTIKKAEHQRIDAFESKTLASPWGCKDIKLVNPKGNPSWIFIYSTNLISLFPTQLCHLMLNNTHRHWPDRLTCHCPKIAPLHSSLRSLVPPPFPFTHRTALICFSLCSLLILLLSEYKWSPC